MLVRREQPDDGTAVRAVVAEAFARSAYPGHVPTEVRLLDELRADAAWLPALSIVAMEADIEAKGEQVIGHVVCTRASVDGQPALGLGPLAVRPDRQRQGVGTALMHTILGAADALDEPLVALLGGPEYYRRFGFRASSVYRITPPDPRWGQNFQVRTLSAYQPIAGTFAYAPPFRRI